MRNFINSRDIIDYQYLLNDINKHKNNSTDLSFVGKNKVLGLLFFKGNDVSGFLKIFFSKDFILVIKR